MSQTLVQNYMVHLSLFPLSVTSHSNSEISSFYHSPYFYLFFQFQCTELRALTASPDYSPYHTVLILLTWAALINLLPLPPENLADIWKPQSGPFEFLVSKFNVPVLLMQCDFLMYSTNVSREPAMLVIVLRTEQWTRHMSLSSWSLQSGREYGHLVNKIRCSECDDIGGSGRSRNYVGEAT